MYVFLSEYRLLNPALCSILRQAGNIFFQLLLAADSSLDMKKGITVNSDGYFVSMTQLVAFTGTPGGYGFNSVLNWVLHNTDTFFSEAVRSTAPSVLL